MIEFVAQSSTGGDGYLLWGFALLAAALFLLIVELFIPSGGLIGMLCGVCAIGSVVAFFRYDTMWGIVAAASYIILTPIVIVFIFKLWVNSPIGRGMILGGEVDRSADTSDEAYAASEQARVDRLAELTALIGFEGTAVTDLRPVGTVRINDRRIDALAETGVIVNGTPVIVTDVYDNQIKVRPA